MVQLQNPRRGFLCSVGLNPEILVEFQYNPTSLADKRAVTYATLNAPGLLMPVRQYSQGGDRSLTFSVRLDGLHKGPSDDRIPISLGADGSITPELNKYRAFLYPQINTWRTAGGSFVPLYKAVNQFASPPRCRFGFGQDRLIECIVTDVSITETLFNPALAPLRADISVTIVELSPYGNTPTPPGR
jgi:hypothetical protein